MIVIFDEVFIMSKVIYVGLSGGVGVVVRIGSVGILLFKIVNELNVVKLM